MKITVRNRLAINVATVQKARLAKLRTEALSLLARHTADTTRPCVKGVCQAEVRLKNFIQATEIKERFLDAEILRLGDKLWPWTTMSHEMWLAYISDAALEGAVMAYGEFAEEAPASIFSTKATN